MKGSYYIHNPERWHEKDFSALEGSLNKEYKFDVAAARGEGAGGAGFDTIVEFLFTNPISTSILGAVIYDIAKKFVHKPPKNRPAVPEGVPSTCKLVVHTNEGIIAINLDSNIKDIEIAMSKVPDLAKENKSRAYQNGDDWDVY